MLSEATIELGEKLGQKFRPQKKLVPTLYDKDGYICHSSNLKFYVEQGLVLKKIHRVLAFTQTAWLEPFIRLNAERRKSSINAFSKDFYKLMSNAVSTYLLTYLLTYSNYFAFDTRIILPDAKYIQAHASLCSILRHLSNGIIIISVFFDRDNNKVDSMLSPSIEY